MPGKAAEARKEKVITDESSSVKLNCSYFSVDPAFFPAHISKWT